VASRLLRVALTGGIATGKSYCAGKFAAHGARSIDADALAREAVAPGTPGLAAVVQRFGEGVLHGDGKLNRSALGKAVFADREARKDLEEIVHPVVYQKIRQWFDTLASAVGSSGAIAVASVPLLYETGRSGEFDVVVVAACSTAQQVERLIARDGLSPGEARQRLASQWPIKEKVRLADYVIDTSGTFEATDRQVEEVWRRLVEKSTSGVV
jgi:dephospho-CoA kinase